MVGSTASEGCTGDDAADEAASVGTVCDWQPAAQVNKPNQDSMAHDLAEDCFDILDSLSIIAGEGVSERQIGFREIRPWHIPDADHSGFEVFDNRFSPHQIPLTPHIVTC